MISIYRGTCSGGINYTPLVLPCNIVLGQILGKYFLVIANRCLNACRRGNSFAKCNIPRKISLMSNNYILKGHFPELISKDQTSVRLPIPPASPWHGPLGKCFISQNWLMDLLTFRFYSTRRDGLGRKEERPGPCIFSIINWFGVGWASLMAGKPGLPEPRP